MRPARLEIQEINLNRPNFNTLGRPIEPKKSADT